MQVADDGDLMQIIGELAEAKREYDKVAPALRSARETGYGIVMPGVEELNLEDRRSCGREDATACVCGPVRHPYT